jgi:hypothetical protein
MGSIIPNTLHQESIHVDKYLAGFRRDTRLQ